MATSSPEAFVVVHGVAFFRNAALVLPSVRSSSLAHRPLHLVRSPAFSMAWSCGIYDGGYTTRLFRAPVSRYNSSVYAVSTAVGVLGSCERRDGRLGNETVGGEEYLGGLPCRCFRPS